MLKGSEEEVHTSSEWSVGVGWSGVSKKSKIRQRGVFVWVCALGFALIRGHVI